jgi:hypothetical protein
MMLFDVRGRGPAKRLTRDLDFDGYRRQFVETADKDGGWNENSRANSSWTITDDGQYGQCQVLIG